MLSNLVGAFTMACALGKDPRLRHRRHPQPRTRQQPLKPAEKRRRLYIR